MNTQKKNNQEKVFNNYNKKVNPILIVGGIILLFAPLLLTREYIFEALDFSDTGEIGDTIGGITAPIIGLIGALLVYYSFRAQIEMNRIQWEAIKDQRKELQNQKKEKEINKKREFAFELFELEIGIIEKVNINAISVLSEMQINGDANLKKVIENFLIAGTPFQKLHMLYNAQFIDNDDVTIMYYKTLGHDMFSHFIKNITELKKIFDENEKYRESIGVKNYDKLHSTYFIINLMKLIGTE